MSDQKFIFSVAKRVSQTHTLAIFSLPYIFAKKGIQLIITLPGEIINDTSKVWFYSRMGLKAFGCSWVIDRPAQYWKQRIYFQIFGKQIMDERSSEE